MIEELWKDIPGFSGYQASNLGRIKAIAKKENGKRLCIRKERIFKMKTVDTCGYVSVQINGTKLAHRLIAAAWIPNIESKPFINHKNGIKTDNRIENLEWCTRSENTIHSFQIGAQCNKGENHPRDKITQEIAEEIRSKYVSMVYPSRKLAVEYGLSKTNILDIIHNRIWSYDSV